MSALKDTDKILMLNGSGYPARELLNIADDLLQGEIRLADGDPGTAAGFFAQAVARQDGLPYMEPPFWYYPARQSLGLALLRAGRACRAHRPSGPPHLGTSGTRNHADSSQKAPHWRAVRLKTARIVEII